MSDGTVSTLVAPPVGHDTTAAAAAPDRARRLEVLVALALTAAVLAVAWAAPWLRFVLTVALAKGLAVLGVLLLLRAGQVSFGHALYVATAAYAVAFLAPRLGDTLLLIPVAALCSAALGLFVGLFVSRYREIFFGMLNLALSMVAYSLLEKLYSITHGTDGIRVAATTLAGASPGREAAEWTLLAIALALALGCGAFVRAYLRAPPGEALAAVASRETRLGFLGIPADRVLLAAYVLSATLAGLGGALIALATRHVTPLLAYWTASGELVFVAILGGTGAAVGPFLGALAFELVRVYASAAAADAWQMVLGFALLGVVLFAARGLWGAVESVARRLARPA